MERTTVSKRRGRLFEIRKPIPKTVYWLAALSAFLVPLLLWAVASKLEVVEPVFLPSPSSVFDTMVTFAQNGQLWVDVQSSVYRVSVGFLAAAILAIPLGILMGTFHIAEAIIEPLVNFIRYMPAAAFIPLIMLYIGIGEDAKMSIIFIGTFFQLILLVAAGARSVAPEMISVAYTLGYNRLGVLLKVIVPAMLPGLLDNLRIVLGWGWTYVIVAEFIAAEDGLGFRIMQAQRFLKTDTIFLYIILIGLLGLLFDQLIKYCSKAALPWAEGFQQ